MAGAAIGLRGLGTAPVDVATPLLRAIENLAGADVTVSLEAYRPTWPYARPTTALTEVVRTIGLLGERPSRRWPGSPTWPGSATASAALRDGMQRVVDAAAADSGCCGSGTCACCAPPVRAQAAPLPDAVPTATVLEDQDGRTTAFDEFFTGRPAVVAFFYTRCDNPRSAR